MTSARELFKGLGYELDKQEVLCDISANSHDIIHKIVEDYFKGDN